jgi:hypothetical protein
MDRGLPFYKMTAEKENTSLNVTTAIVTDNDDKLQLMKGKRTAYLTIVSLFAQLIRFLYCCC